MLTQEQWGMIEKEMPTFLKKQEEKRDYVAFLAFMYESGEVYYHSNVYCHAGMNNFYNYNKEKKPLITIMSGIQGVKANYSFSREEMIKYADWLCFNSPWKGCFLNKSAEEVVDTCWLLNPETPSNFLAGAAFATRHPTEWPRLFKSWLLLVDLGIDPNKAFLHSFYLSSPVKKQYPITINTEVGWHQPVHSGRDRKYFENFLKATPENLEGPYNKVFTYRRVSDVWGGCGRINYNNFQAIKPMVVKIKEENCNIFYKPKIKQQRNTYLFEGKEQILTLVEKMERMIYAAA